MTGEEMLDVLRNRTEDADDDAFSEQSKLDELNAAIIELAAKAPREFVARLEQRKLYIPSGDFVEYLSGEDVIPILRNRFLRIVDKDTNLEYYFESDLDNLKKLRLNDSGGMMHPDTNNPIAWAIGGWLYADPMPTNLWVWYVEAPTEYTTVTGGADAECELDISLHDVACRLAEMALWMMNDDLQRAQTAQAIAGAKYQMLTGTALFDRKIGVAERG